jgi:hypothetical protein
MNANNEQILEHGSVLSIFVDGLCALVTVGNVTHLLFTTREPQASEAGKIYREVQARMIIPNNCLVEIGRAILKGAPIVPSPRECDGEENTPLH